MKEYIFLSIEMDIYGKLFAVFLGIHQQQKHEVDIHKEEEKPTSRRTEKAMRNEDTNRFYCKRN